MTELEVLQIARGAFPAEFRAFDPRVWWVAYLVELEHGTRNPWANITNDDALETLKIAVAHLRESEDYYAHLRYVLERSDPILDRELLPPVVSDPEWTPATAAPLIWRPTPGGNIAPSVDFLRKHLSGAVPFNSHAFAYSTMQSAIAVELTEHAIYADADVVHSDIVRAASIVLAHLNFHPDYYDFLNTVERRFDH